MAIVKMISNITHSTREEGRGEGGGKAEMFGRNEVSRRSWL